MSIQANNSGKDDVWQHIGYTAHVVPFVVSGAGCSVKMPSGEHGQACPGSMPANSSDRDLNRRSPRRYAVARVTSRLANPSELPPQGRSLSHVVAWPGRVVLTSARTRVRENAWERTVTDQLRASEREIADLGKGIGISFPRMMRPNCCHCAVVWLCVEVPLEIRANSPFRLPKRERVYPRFRCHWVPEGAGRQPKYWFTVAGSLNLGPLGTSVGKRMCYANTGRASTTSSVPTSEAKAAATALCASTRVVTGPVPPGTGV